MADCTAESAETGAPEIEVTPEMIESLEDAFMGWWARNDHALSLGGSGDVLDLLLTLNAALANTPSACYDPPAA
jgi:hypothetical protein